MAGAPSSSEAPGPPGSRRRNGGIAWAFWRPASALALFAALGAPRAVAAQAWSAAPRALVVRDAMFEQAKAAVHALRVGDGPGRTVLLVKRVPVEEALDLNVEKALQELDSTSAQPRFLESTRKALRSHIGDQFRAENVSAYWYVYGTAPNFAEALCQAFPDGAGASPSRGHVIRATAEDERVMFSATALRWEGHPVRALSQRTKAELLVLDDPTGLSGPLSRSGKLSVKAVLEVDIAGRDLGAVRDQVRALLGLRGLSLGEVAVLDLLPSSPEEARASGFEPPLGGELEESARRLAAVLARRGMKQDEGRVRSTDALVGSANVAKAQRKRVLLFAGADKDGASIRIPGQAVALTEADVRRMDPDTSFVAVLFETAASRARPDAFAYLGAVSAGSASPLLGLALRHDPSKGQRPFAEVDVGGPSSVLAVIREAAPATRGANKAAFARLYEFDARALADAMRARAPTADEGAAPARAEPAPARDGGP